MSTATQKKSFFEDLVDRRFFRFFGTYLGVCFALLQFGEFVEKRFDVGHGLVEKLLIFLALMIPAVVVFIYNHGRPGDDKWTKFEKSFIPINLIFAIGASFLLAPKSHGPLKKEVSIITEEGDTLNMMVPTLEQSKRISIFPFEKTNGTQNSWEPLASSILTDLDLEQDMHFIGINANGMQEDYSSYGKEWLKPIPFSTKLKISQDNYSDYFLASEYAETAEGNLEFDVKLVDSNNGEIFYEQEIQAESLFEGIDKITKDIKDHLILPEAQSQNDQVIDLPASDLITSNPEALENYFKAIISVNQNLQNPMASIPYAEKAYDIDESCAECYALAANIYATIGNRQQEVALYAKALTNSDLLPDRQRMGIRGRVYGANGEFEKLRTLFQNWKAIYPGDYKPYSSLMFFAEQTLQYDDAIKYGEDALENGHKGPNLTKLSQLYMQKDDIESAERYFNMFKKSYPHKAKESTIPADIYKRKGEFDAALAHLEKMSILEPSDMGINMDIAEIQQKLGQYENAAKTYATAYSFAKDIRDSINIRSNEESLSFRLGQLNKAIDQQEQRKEWTKRIATPMQVDFGQFATIYRYVMANRQDDMIAIFDDLRAKYAQLPFTDCLTRFMQSAMLQDKESFLPAYENCKPLMVQMNGPNYAYYCDGMKYYVEENYTEAAEQYQTFVDSSGVTLDEVNGLLVEVYRKSEQYDRAEEIINDILGRDPINPYYLLEKAKLENDMGNQEAATDHLKKAMEVWVNADESYQQLIDAKELAVQLGI